MSAQRRSADPIPPVSGSSREYLARHRMFTGLSEALLDEVASRCVSRSYAKGHYLFRAGDHSSFVFIIRSGLVALSQMDERGHVHPLLTFEPGTVFGLAASILGVERYLDAMALGPTEALLVPRNLVEELRTKDIRFSNQVTRELCEILRASEQRIYSLTATPVPLRLARYLLDNASPASAGSPPSVLLTISHSDLALLLGTTRETISRVLASLARAHLISVAGRKITIKRPEELRALLET